MKKVATIALATALLSGCSDGPKAARVLSDAGYKDVHITGYRVFGCSDDDTFTTGFNAVSVSGKRVTGVVCSDFLKAATIRVD